MYSDECDCTKARICRNITGREREVRETAGKSTDDSSKKTAINWMLKYDDI